MRIATMAGWICLAGALSGCNGGQRVEFVASNPDSVILDFSARPPGELVTANETATQQCQLFSHRTAVLESLNTRGEGGLIRATYLCKGGTPYIESTDTTRRRMRRQ